MRLTYTLAVIVVGIAMFVAWRFLPARATEELHEVPTDEALYRATEDAAAI